MKQIAIINLIIVRSTIFSNNMQQNTNEIQNKVCTYYARDITHSHPWRLSCKIDSKKVA